jgi:hypothetical protein
MTGVSFDSHPDELRSTTLRRIPADGQLAPARPDGLVCSRPRWRSCHQLARQLRRETEGFRCTNKLASPMRSTARHAQLAAVSSLDIMS